MKREQITLSKKFLASFVLLVMLLGNLLPSMNVFALEIKDSKNKAKEITNIVEEKENTKLDVSAVIPDSNIKVHDEERKIESKVVDANLVQTTNVKLNPEKRKIPKLNLNFDEIAVEKDFNDTTVHGTNVTQSEVKEIVKAEDKIYNEKENEKLKAVDLNGISNLFSKMEKTNVVDGAKNNFLAGSSAIYLDGRFGGSRANQSDVDFYGKVKYNRRNFKFGYSDIGKQGSKIYRVGDHLAYFRLVDSSGNVVSNDVYCIELGVNVQYAGAGAAYSQYSKGNKYNVDLNKGLEDLEKFVAYYRLNQSVFKTTRGSQAEARDMQAMVWHLLGQADQGKVKDRFVWFFSHKDRLSRTGIEKSNWVASSLEVNPETLKATFVDKNGSLNGAKLAVQPANAGTARVNGNKIEFTYNLNSGVENVNIKIVKPGIKVNLQPYYPTRHDGQTIGILTFTDTSIEESVDVTSPPVQVELLKVPVKPDYAKDNDAYNLTGAKYAFYRTHEDAEKRTKPVATTVIKNNDGVSEKVNLMQGTYYVREYDANDTKGYLINENIKEIKVEMGKNLVGENRIVLDDEMAEPMKADPLDIRLFKKLKAGVTNTSENLGDISLEGIQFKLDYYKGIHENIKAVEDAGLKPEASIIYKTNENGNLFLKEAESVNGEDWKYLNSDNRRIYPLGTYILTELNAPDGVINDNMDLLRALFRVESGEFTTVNIVKAEGFRNKEIVGASEDVITELVKDNQAWYGGVKFDKRDRDLVVKLENPVHTSQGDASLKGAEFELINRSKTPIVLKDDTVIGVGEVIQKLITDENGYAETKADLIPYGTYELKEVKAPIGYLLNEEQVITFKITKEGELEDLTFESGKYFPEDVIRGGVKVGKADRETKQYMSLGGASLEGINFEIENASKKAVFVDGKLYNPGEIVKVITTKLEQNENGEDIYVARTEDNTLPYGTYIIREKGPRDSKTGYLWDDISKAWTKKFRIGYSGETIGESEDAYSAEDKTYADLTDLDDVVKNQVIRQDFHFIKKDAETMERMGMIPFKVTSLSTGESHIIVTDENGNYHSSARTTEEWEGFLHSEKTNANDPTSPITNGAVRVVNGKWKVTDTSKLDPTAGTWFTGVKPEKTVWAEDGKSYMVGDVKVNVRDDLRAFPFDTYKIEELECDNNRGYEMVNAHITLHRYTRDHNGIGIDIDYGTIDNTPTNKMNVGTLLMTEDGKKEADVKSAIKLIDKVEISGAEIGKNYQVDGEIHKVKDGKDEGIVAVNTVKTKASVSNFTIEVPFNVNTEELEGYSLVAFETVYLVEEVDGEEVLTQVGIHADINDKNQTIEVKSTIGTKAIDYDTSTQQASFKEKIRIDDIVSYKGLVPGIEYEVKGSLHIKELDSEGYAKDAGVLVDKNGKLVESTAKFTPEKSDGEVTVTFEFEVEPDKMKGKTVVAFEDLYKGDKLIASHSKIDAEEQTVYFGKLKTILANIDGKKSVNIDSKVKLIDKLEYSNLLANKEYKTEGEIHHVRGGKDLGVISKGETISKLNSTYGEIEVEFTVDTSNMKKGDTLVAFERTYIKAEDGSWKLIAVHEDINDENQTVDINEVPAVPPVTGIEAISGTMLLGMGLLFVGYTVYVFVRRSN